MTTTDHVTEVSLIEQLKSVPLDSRELIKNDSGLGLRNIPYGRYCKEAAEALQKAEAEVERLRGQLTRAIQIVEWCEEYIRTEGWPITADRIASEIDQLKSALSPGT